MKKDIQDIVKAEFAANFDAMYKKVATKYGVSDTPLHKHNGIDSPHIPNASMNDFLTLPSNGNGVLAPANIGVPDGNNGQSVNNSEIGIPPTVIVPQVPIIYGHGSGVWSQFNGGDAPEGTMLFFNNGPTISGLWIKSGGDWFGIGQTSTGYGNTII